MEDINKNDFEENKKKEEVETENVSSYKDVVVNPDKQEVESKFHGMKDLFTSILSENRKDYEKQIGEMRNMFTTILEENRKQFQIQLQDMYKALPQIINEADKIRREEEYVFLNDEEGVEKGAKSAKYSKMSAIKELIIGKDSKFLDEKMVNLEEDIALTLQQDKDNLASVAGEIYERLEKLERRIMSELEKVYKGVMSDLDAQSSQLANKKETYKTVKGVVEYLKSLQ